MGISRISGLFKASEGDDLHQAACDFVFQEYQKRFNCEVKTFYPNSYSLYEDGVLLAVAGFRCAADHTLFLEQYLDTPVQQCLSNCFNEATDRSAIVELGGFAALGRKAAIDLMIGIAPALSKLGFSKLVCTANKPIACCLHKLGIKPVVLTRAREEHLRKDGIDWGTYYKGKPVVLAGDINDALAAMPLPGENVPGENLPGQNAA